MIGIDDVGALDGLVVADFGRVLAGPYATMLLADFGAEVIKIKRPGLGDDTRSWGPPWVDGEATYFAGVNRNKRSVSIDLGTPEGRTQARQLATEADVVVENFKPGTMERLGLGYEQLRTKNPGLVFCSISGFGQTGGAELPGYDLLVQAVGGLPDGVGRAAELGDGQGCIKRIAVPVRQHWREQLRWAGAAVRRC